MDHSAFHALRPSEVFDALDTAPTGLTAEQAASRLSLFGPNSLAAAPGPSLWRILLGHLTHLEALLLWAAGLLALLSDMPVLGVVIWLVVLVNAGFSFWQEYRAQQALEALRGLLPAYARALRGGAEGMVPATEIVPGDVLVLAEGDSIPADARVVEEFGLRTNNSTLTGEAMPARRSSEASLNPDLTELERPNLVFAGTSVVSGTGRAVVSATGMLTQFGRIVRLTEEVREQPSPLQREIRRATRIISLVAVGMGAVVFSVGSTQLQLPLAESFLLAVGIVVAAVPEGLTPTITLALAAAVQRLAQRGLLVKKLAIVETLGTVSVICTDKSGTLTENQMTIRELWVAGQRLRVTGVGYEPKGEFLPSPAGAPFEDDLRAVLLAGMLCNNARLNPPTPEKPHWSSLGDQTEVAFRVLALKGGLDERRASEARPRVHELPFDARRKRMTTLHRNERGLTAYVKGAPREVLQLCTHILWNGQVRPLEDSTRAAILQANDEFARGTLRVLALAQRDLPPRIGGFTAEGVEAELTFLGLAGMLDPPRPEVAGAIERCREGGIRLVMITGDYGLTAESLARRVGMVTTPHPVILTGAELDALTDARLQELLRREEVIFARMAPDHKLRLVDCFQTMGEVVAVIGDGVNDAPALRRADVGIAMGVAGTDVAKEAADLIVVRDDFASIARAMEEGRAAYDNLRKFAGYIFASNVPEILPFVLTALLNIPLALRVQQILAIDLGTDLLPALALGTEAPDPDALARPPRRRTQRLLDAPLFRRAFLWVGALEAALCYAAFGLVYAAFGYGEVLRIPRLPWLEALNPLRLPLTEVHVLATSVFLAGVVTAQVGNAFASRAQNGGRRGPGLLSNRMLLLAILAELALILALIYAEPLARTFVLRPLPPIYWAVLVLFAPVLYGTDRLARMLVGRLRGARRLPGG